MSQSNKSPSNLRGLQRNFDQKKYSRKSSTPNNKFAVNLSNAFKHTPKKMKRPVSLENVQEDKFVA